MTSASVDIINELAGIVPGAPIDRLRDRREQAKTNAQRSFVALLEPTQAGAFNELERYAVATYVAGLHGLPRARAFYADLLSDAADAGVVAALDEAIREGAASGPYGDFREPELAAESQPGPSYSASTSVRARLGERLTAAIEHTHLLVLHPRDSRADALRPLALAGWNEDDIVSLSQLVSFLSFQLRVSAGLEALAQAHGDAVEPLLTGDVAGDAADAAAASGLAAGNGLTHPPITITEYPQLHRPKRFQQGGLDWVPWIDPVAEAQLTERQIESLVEPQRVKSQYFRLLARDPDALEARTLTDKDIFFNTADGLPRAERELAAAVTSRFNGCVYCASVHSRAATRESGRGDDVQRLLDAGVTADLGDERWNAVSAAAVQLARTPVAFGADDVRKLADAGLDDGEIIDVVNGAAFFNWANRLMLSLGEPEVIEARLRDSQRQTS